MFKKSSLGVLTLSLSWLIAAAVLPQNGPAPVKATPDQVTFFETKIRPVLANNCLTCHGKTQQLSGLRLDSQTSILKGGDSGAAIVPGDPEKSLLVQAIRQHGSLKMPPNGAKLGDGEIGDIVAWIKMGAPWPSSDDSAKKTTAVWWSLQPVRKPSTPHVKNAIWIKNPLDAFVLAKLESKKISPAPAADRRTLIRRVTYDLTGLPPTVSEVLAFVADKAPNAYDKVVDRLLGSPRYGERWARHWMDVARYADTKGYVFQEDRNYYNAYTYRDWVIAAFNRDMPYDQFITEQLAADRLPEVQNSDDKHALAALGFLTIGRRFINSQPDIIDDRIDVTMRGLQGMTVACARCHDHKFDPIPTQDYYSLYTIFADSDEVASPISDKSVRDPWSEHNKQVTGSQAAIQEMVKAQMKLLRAKNADAQTGKSIDASIKQLLQSIREDQNPNIIELEKLMPAFDPIERDRLLARQKLLDDLTKHTPPVPEFAMAMVDKANCSDGYVFKRGNPGNRGEEAPRRFLLALSKPGEPRAHWTQGSGRLELANAIATKENPLTARVFVNRVWQDHFGTGIVRTPSDFGHQGEAPTDPALLDYLATSFMDNGWSIKKLQKLIVTSATYCQSSAVSLKTFNADPDNRYWSRMNRRRLDLEQTRDTLICDSGQLDTSRIGGKSVDLWSKPFTKRRAVYGFVERQNLPGIFRTFDFASPDSHSARRFFTTVPQQALFFMNSPLTVDETRALVSRPEISTAVDDGQRVRRLYMVLFQRLPTAEEFSAAMVYLKPGGSTEAAVPRRLWSYGYGGYDESEHRVTSFIPFNHFADGNYRVAAAFPDPKLGYLMLTNQGGHPGHDRAHSVVRRWIAPISGTVRISGLIAHRQKEGDGIEARIVSNRSGLVGDWKVHNGETQSAINSLSVQQGDTIDFLVDPMTSDSFDAFQWAPKISTLDGKQIWDAAQNFTGPSDPPVTRLILYAQALLMTNEFAFVD